MMVDYRPQGPFNVPHRKPVPGPNLRPLTQITSDTSFSTSPSSAASQRNPYTSSFPTRTTSVQAPQVVSHHQTPPQSYTTTSTSSPSAAATSTSTTANPQPYNNAMFTSRRTPSQSTSITTTTTTTSGYNTYTHPPPSRTPSNVSSKISRTSSTRSVITPPSYVALMRKQKATVWCDRAQPEDPRISAQHKLAKQRATRELTVGAKGGLAAADSRSTNSGSMGSGSLGVRSKIRHHIPKSHGAGFGTGANLMGGAGVPMRLSANEVGDEGTYEPPRDGVGGGATATGQSMQGSSGQAPPVPHKRNSSLQSANSPNIGSRDSRFLTVDTAASRRYSSGNVSTLSATHDPISNNNIPELEETPPEKHKSSMGSDYFDTGNGGGKSAGGSSSERENSFGVVGSLGGMSGNLGGFGGSSGGLGGPSGGVGASSSGVRGAGHTPSHPPVVGTRARAGSGAGKTAEDLKRRGSVDERGLFPQGTGRLVIANPDVGSDSD